ncbi:MAG: dihydrodipicolinate synthase family protein [Armatimonadetes bacterium]|nr:dihydrodipicolinate synthase family protein [Armatimonadota bacterium]
MPDSLLPRFTGVIAPLFTPCDETGRLDTGGLRSFIRWLKGHRVNTVFCRSGMGRMYTFTLEETMRMAEAALEEADGEMGVVAGAAGIWDGRPERNPDPERYIQETLLLVESLRAMGADGAVLVVPLALAPSGSLDAAGVIYDYFAQVSRAASLPLLIYQPPGLPEACRMTPALLRDIAALPQIAGIKLSTGDPDYFASLARAAVSPSFAFITGNEALYLEGLRLGSVGVIGQGCCLYPELLDALREKFLSGDIAGAERAQADVHRALRAFKGLDAVTAGKQILIRRGVRMLPYDRSGTLPYSDEVIDKLEAALKR